MGKLAGVLVLLPMLLVAANAQAMEVGGNCTDPHTILVAGIEAVVFPLESASQNALPATRMVAPRSPPTKCLVRPWP